MQDFTLAGYREYVLIAADPGRDELAPACGRLRLPSAAIEMINRSLLTNDITTGADLDDLMHQAVSELPNAAFGRTVWYMDKQVLGFLRRQTANAVSNSTLSTDMVGGTMQTSWGGFPIRRCDALSVDEARVT